MPGRILVIAEQRAGRISQESLELVTFAEKLALITADELMGLVLGFPVQDLALQFANESGLKVIGIENQALRSYNGEAYLKALFKFISKENPSYVLIPHTATGMDFAPRLAVVLGASCITGVVGIKKQGSIKFIRQICGGKMITENEPIKDTMVIITVMPGVEKAQVAKGEGSVEILAMDPGPLKSQTLGYIEAKRVELDLSKAEVIISVGRGIKGPENLGLAQSLKELFEKSALGASRPVVDAGWLPYQHQIGLTGQTVKPKLYLALGISGAIQHLVGMKDSELIVAINTDPKANIFSFAHLGIVQDLEKFLPVLIEKIKRLKKLP